MPKIKYKPPSNGNPHGTTNSQGEAQANCSGNSTASNNTPETTMASGSNAANATVTNAPKVMPTGWVCSTPRTYLRERGSRPRLVASNGARIKAIRALSAEPSVLGTLLETAIRCPTFSKSAMERSRVVSISKRCCPPSPNWT